MKYDRLSSAKQRPQEFVKGMIHTPGLIAKWYYNNTDS